MPPGMLHCVYTPRRCVTAGAHFWTYDTMEATLKACRLDKVGAVLANADAIHVPSLAFTMGCGLYTRDERKCFSPPITPFLTSHSHRHSQPGIAP